MRKSSPGGEETALGIDSLGGWGRLRFKEGVPPAEEIRKHTLAPGLQRSWKEFR
jgi:hypothetical protein